MGRPPASPLALVLALVTAGCGEDFNIGEIEQAITARCTINVTGKGVKQVETDYLPHVVACENGGADTEALKAQAVAARSFMYYKASSSGSICDGTSCQVYTCGNQPSSKHYAAVSATAGQVLMYSGVVICAFYVAGAKPSTSTCKALSSDPDPTKTEKYVTYNEGKSGNGITQSSLGWVSSTNKYNRGCKSQNGAHCQSLKGKKYPEILRFYYGADIQIVTATGSCVTPPKPDAAPPPKPDSKPPPKPDSKPPPKPDSKPPPKPDSAPPLKPDSKPQPGQDSGTPLPGQDGKGPGPRQDLGKTPPVYTGNPQVSLQGGCAVSAAPDAWPGCLLLLLALSLRRGRGRSRERP